VDFESDPDVLCVSGGRGLAQRVVESERGKRLREDSLMLVRGLDSVVASLAQLSDTLTAAQKVFQQTTPPASIPSSSSPSVVIQITESVLVPVILFQGVSALATCSSQARGCEGGACPEEVEEEEPKAKRMCGGSTEDSPRNSNSPAAGEETAAGPDGLGKGNVQASAEVAQSTNLKRARNVGCMPLVLFFSCDLYG